MICSRCLAKGDVPYVEHPLCFDRPQNCMPADHEDWLCNACKTEAFNSDLQRVSKVEFDEHVKYVYKQFLPDEEEPDTDGCMRNVPFQMAAIADVPKEYAIGLIVGPSGSGKTLLLKGRFGYDATPFKWKDDVAVISQVHEDKEEAMRRLIKMGSKTARSWREPSATAPPLTSLAPTSGPWACSSCARACGDLCESMDLVTLPLQPAIRRLLSCSSPHGQYNDSKF